MSGIRGDFAKLAQLTAKFRRGASTSSGMYESLKKNLAAEALTQVSLGFRGSRDPYGNPWRPLKIRQGKPLLDTARLRNSFSSQVTSTGFRVGTNVGYAAPHQFGSKRGRPPQRQMLPSGRLGAIWSASFAAAGRTSLRKFFK